MIARRTLRLTQEGGDIAIEIRVFAPEDSGQGWFCKYEIDWPEGKQIMQGWGVDSVQAILLAFQMIGADIYSSSYHKSGRLSFEKPGRGYGFPVSEGIRDLLVGDDRKYM